MVAKRKTTPKANSLLKKYGYSSGTVERFYGGFNHDWMGFADIMAYRSMDGFLPGEGYGLADEPDVDFSGCLAVQCCTANNLREHIDKVIFDDTQKGRKRSKDLMEFLQCGGNRFEIWAFPTAAWIKKHPTTKQEDYMKVQRIVVDDSEFYILDSTELECFGFSPKIRA